jgi:hypothetical protein
MMCTIPPSSLWLTTSYDWAANRDLPWGYVPLLAQAAFIVQTWSHQIDGCRARRRELLRAGVDRQ